jgi:hypothetical protein
VTTGKAYANRKIAAARPVGDFYSTPKSLVWAAEEILLGELPVGSTIMEPCYGKGAISDELVKLGYKVLLNDLYSVEGGEDYLLQTVGSVPGVVTNPPFSLWDEFVLKAKGHANKVVMIGRLNYLGTVGRFASGIWNGLKLICPFNRYVDYQTPYRVDGLFHVGAMATAWFVWDRAYSGYPMVRLLDVQRYATLGNYK